MVTRVVLLGTGTPNPDPKRSGPAVAIIVDKSVHLVDFGPGIVRRTVEAGISPSQLTSAFLTHLHSDHSVGYPDLILTPAVVGRNVPLNVYGPKGLKSMTNHILSAYEEDINERISGLEPAIKESYVVNTYEIPETTVSIVYQDDTITVEAFPVNHGSWPAYGFKFSTLDKTVVISGDTAPTQTIVEMARNCDILIHDVYSAVSIQTRPPEWKEYHSAMHTSSYELAEIASQAKPELLVLYHQLSWGRTHDELLSEVRKRYDGDVVSGKDLDCF
jgi:ribonuclease BN (tRNA processing enzyme)